MHLVRDPVAVADSWRTPKDYVYVMSASKSTAYWRGFNIASRAILRRYPQQSILLRYEDFIADPAGTIATLMRLAGADPAGNPVTGRTVQLHTNHTVTGNPDRFRHRRDGDPRLGRPVAQRAWAGRPGWPPCCCPGRCPGATVTATRAACSAGRPPTDRRPQPAARRAQRSERTGLLDLGLRNKVALVAGGSSGIGLAVATELAAEGAHVAIGARGVEQLKQAAHGLEQVAPAAGSAPARST